MTPTPPGTSGELKSCPFCGSYNILVIGGVTVQCDNTACPIFNKSFTHKGWNTRTPERKESPDEAGLIVAVRRQMRLSWNDSDETAKSLIDLIRSHLAPDTDVLPEKVTINGCYIFSRISELTRAATTWFEWSRKYKNETIEVLDALEKVVRKYGDQARGSGCGWLLNEFSTILRARGR